MLRGTKIEMPQIQVTFVFNDRGEIASILDKDGEEYKRIDSLPKEEIKLLAVTPTALISHTRVEQGGGMPPMPVASCCKLMGNTWYQVPCEKIHGLPDDKKIKCHSITVKYEFDRTGRVSSLRNKDGREFKRKPDIPDHRHGVNMFADEPLMLLVYSDKNEQELICVLKLAGKRYQLLRERVENLKSTKQEEVFVS
jgi:hypothetical protein